MSAIRVDFYLLSQSASEARMQVACRLLEKTYLHNHSAYIICKSKEHAIDLDQMLWTYKDASFIPHSLQGELTEFYVPLQIGCLEDSPQSSYNILFNLTDEIPIYYQQFSRIIEIIPNDEQIKSMSRRRYHDYRSQQCSLYVHSLN